MVETLFLLEKQNFYKTALKAFEAARTIYKDTRKTFKRNGPRPGPEDRWARASERRHGAARGPAGSPRRPPLASLLTSATAHPLTRPHQSPSSQPATKEKGERGRAKPHRKRRRRAAAHFRLPSRNPSGIDISVPWTWERDGSQAAVKNRVEGRD
ncbi:hypothetical protein HispidOSU_022215 [Sigmodon hispidus]